MKKLLCYLLFLSLFLTACAPIGLGTVPETTPHISQTETEQPETTAPTEDYRPQGNVTVDFSVYEKGESTYVTSLYTLPEDEIGELLPLSSPKTLYPYAGDITRNYYGYVEEYLYGLADSSGTLITKPIYNNISLLKDYDTGETLPYWVLSIASKERYSEGDDDYEYFYARIKYGLVSMDGTFYLDCIYDTIRLDDGRILCGQDGEPAGTPPLMEAYDSHGTLCFSTARYDFGVPLANCYGNYGEGLYVLYLKSSDPNAEAYDSSCYFVTEKGEIVFGPFDSAYAFSDGMAVVDIGGYQYKYLRLDGTMLPETYRYAGEFKNGIAEVNMNFSDDSAIIDKNGTRILSFSGYSSITADGYIIIHSYNNATSEFTRCYDKSGRFLWEINVPDPNVISEDLYYYEANDRINLCSVSTGRTVSFPLYYYPEYYDHPTDPYIVVYAYNLDEDGYYTQHILTPDLETFTEIRSLSVNFKEQVYLPSLNLNGIVIRTGDEVTLYESPHNIIGTYTVDEFTSATVCPNGTVSFCSNLWGALYDKNCKMFFRYAINAMDD